MRASYLVLSSGLAVAVVASPAPAQAPPPEPGSAPETEPAPSAPPATAPPPYAAQPAQRGYPPPPGPPPPAQGAPPEVGAPQYSRRPVELIPTLGLAFPICRKGTLNADRCEGIGGGGMLGFSALWRVTPHFAWGGGFALAGFRYRPPERLGLSNTNAGAVWLGLLGRAYFLDESSIDPYVQLGIGGGALGTTYDDPNGKTYEETGAGPALQVGGGIDFFLSRTLKLGPSLFYTHVFVDKITRCEGSGQGSCSDVSKDEAGHLNAVLSLGATLTIMLGQEF